MKNRVIFLLLTLVLVLTTATTAMAEEYSNVNVISVNGQGIVKAKPDQAVVTIAVITEDKTAKQAQHENGQLVNKAVQALKSIGIAEQDIITQNYNLQPRYNYGEKTAPIIVGYTVQNEIIVTVKDTDKLGNVLDIAVSNGINRIRNISFCVDNDQELKVKALKMAVVDARAKADVIAASLGMQIVGVKSASGNWGTNNPGPFYYAKEVQADAGLGTTPINPGEIEITAYSEIVFIIDKK
ncbi:SIMPL domain-containing protein [Desulfolucanica intricata]|uniref:SIMPL domain-containing protein n=1 Tax=Desulfolucanica intricata TaxID=1285191 RepID=UPI0008296D1C|nr:SIMPL domain-containing protein [Desulfolucanica intricata]